MICRLNTRRCWAGISFLWKMAAESRLSAVYKSNLCASITNDGLTLQPLACSRLRDSVEKSFSKKKCGKRAGAGERPAASPIFLAATAPFPSRARLIFALLVLIRPHYTIWEPGTGYSTTGNSNAVGENNHFSVLAVQYTHSLASPFFLAPISLTSACYAGYKLLCTLAILPLRS